MVLWSIVLRSDATKVAAGVEVVVWGWVWVFSATELLCSPSASDPGSSILEHCRCLLRRLWLSGLDFGPGLVDGDAKCPHQLAWLAVFNSGDLGDVGTGLAGCCLDHGLDLLGGLPWQLIVRQLVRDGFYKLIHQRFVVMAVTVAVATMVMVAATMAAMMITMVPAAARKSSASTVMVVAPSVTVAATVAVA
jgi:hypothetical protein